MERRQQVRVNKLNLTDVNKLCHTLCVVLSHKYLHENAALVSERIQQHGRQLDTGLLTHERCPNTSQFVTNAMIYYEKHLITFVMYVL